LSDSVIRLTHLFPSASETPPAGGHPADGVLLCHRVRACSGEHPPLSIPECKHVAAGLLRFRSLNALKKHGCVLAAL